MLGHGAGSAFFAFAPPAPSCSGKGCPASPWRPSVSSQQRRGLLGDASVLAKPPAVPRVRQVPTTLPPTHYPMPPEAARVAWLCPPRPPNYRFLLVGVVVVTPRAPPNSPSGCGKLLDGASSALLPSAIHHCGGGGHPPWRQPYHPSGYWGGLAESLRPPPPGSAFFVVRQGRPCMQNGAPARRKGSHGVGVSSPSPQIPWSLNGKDEMHPETNT